MIDIVESCPSNQRIAYQENVNKALIKMINGYLDDTQIATNTILGENARLRAENIKLRQLVTTHEISIMKGVNDNENDM